ncbi:ABC transporter ATP-binding protein [Leptospira ryugenii]|uniref:ABC transporter ATP-binding protein n=1 Tax=Leptospira ryugenii TaxID=1917863 RepID=A0A2P2E2B8_9LEPT|nr:ABC transporter ATP-binding protein [Leptospira ryugenii]GBF51045.1 ABC transporter ATP-binding protein [Leptospira ryugenii]
MTVANENNLLDVRDLSVSLHTEHGTVGIIEGISFAIQKGEIFALVGESGCGKSISSLSLTRLLPANTAEYPKGEVLFLGKDLLKLPEGELRKIRGKEIAYIFQEPFSALNPLHKIGAQLTEGFLYHGLGNERQALDKAEYLLTKVGITDVKQRLNQYPNQFSGGMLQRVSIAMALMCDPKLLVADEPTSAIDVTIQLQLIELLLELKREIGMSILFISHDIGLVSHVADRIGVMYAGKLVEFGKTDDVIDHTLHPYAKALIEAYPSSNSFGKRLLTIDGIVPSPKDYPEGCHFFDRCRVRMDICKRQDPPFRTFSTSHIVQCHLEDL